MASIAWGVDGYGKQWAWCEDCGKQFGQVSPFEVEHGHAECPPRPANQRPPEPRKIDEKEPRRPTDTGQRKEARSSAKGKRKGSYFRSCLTRSSRILEVRRGEFSGRKDDQTKQRLSGLA